MGIGRTSRDDYGADRIRRFSEQDNRSLAWCFYGLRMTRA